MRFDSTVSIKEMTEIAEREGATEFKRILPEQRGLTDVKIGKSTAKVKVK